MKINLYTVVDDEEIIGSIINSYLTNQQIIDFILGIDDGVADLSFSEMLIIELTRNIVENYENYEDFKRFIKTLKKLGEHLE